jgi:hypothetical protein
VLVLVLVLVTVDWSLRLGWCGVVWCGEVTVRRIPSKQRPELSCDAGRVREGKLRFLHGRRIGMAGQKGNPWAGRSSRVWTVQEAMSV